MMFMSLICLTPCSIMKTAEGDFFMYQKRVELHLHTAMSKDAVGLNPASYA